MLSGYAGRVSDEMTIAASTSVLIAFVPLLMCPSSSQTSVCPENIRAPRLHLAERSKTFRQRIRRVVRLRSLGPFWPQEIIRGYALLPFHIYIIYSLSITPR